MSESEALKIGDPLAPTPTSRRFALMVGLAFASIFIVLCSVRLEGQGLYADELHQATAAFAFGSTRPEIFEGLSIGGIPVLNMTYSGAIKSGMFAAYLELPGSEFSVVSWRMFGILLAAAGIVGFCVIAGPWIRKSVLLPFLLLSISDGTIILTSRHDWGPTALALALRLVLLAVWIRGEGQAQTPPRNSFLLGLIVGVAIFEKLSNAVLIAAIPLLIGLCPRRRTTRHVGSLVAGLAVGLLPVAAVNVYTLVTEGRLNYVDPSEVTSFLSRTEPLSYVQSYLGVGAGDEVRSFILGPGFGAGHVGAELAMVTVLLVMGAGAGLIWGRRDQTIRAAGIMIACYVAVALATYVLPLATWTHHWIVGTPFQYLGIALAVSGLDRVSKEIGTPLARAGSAAFTILLVGLLALRMLNVVSLEESLMDGRASRVWDPSFTRFAELMSERTDDAMVITAGWGLAPQVYCLAGGAPDFVHELYMGYRRTSDVTNRLDARNRRVFFVARPEWTWARPSARGDQLWLDLDSIQGWAPEWREVGVSDEIRALNGISVRKFVRSS